MAKQNGFVALVGAGPGDPELLTMKAVRHLSQADVVLMDALVHPDVLAHCAESTRVLDVGKRAGGQSVPQEVITEVMLAEARDGKYVVRLKGGDPFVFGRGGEEVEALARESIPFEVVSGVTSSIAAAASSLIPLTHRGVARHFTVATASACDESDPVFTHYKNLLEAGGTVVFLMALGPLPRLAQGLIASGLNPGIPAAMIQDGTLATQRVVRGALTELPARVREAGLAAPALLVVGDVVAVGQEFESIRSSHLLQRQHIRQNQPSIAHS